MFRTIKNKKLILFTVLPLLLIMFFVGHILAATSITSVTPDHGPSTGDTEIVITGSGFTDYTSIPSTNFTATGCTLYTIPTNGYYKLETWGAQGGNAGSYVGGRGGYSTGIVWLTAGTSTWACVGGQGTQASKVGDSLGWPGGANGGGAAFRTDNGNNRETASGGGGTDIRINVNSPYARIIVAGGGGGAAGNQFGSANGGGGGGISGILSTGDSPGGVGTQTTGGVNNASGCTGSGSFGTANSPCSGTATNTSGGGGGWFGGGAGLAASGGSGFTYTSTSNISATAIGGTYLLGRQYQMFDTSMAIGGPPDAMPAPNGGTQTGQSGNGYARITQLPYYALVGDQPCASLAILSDTQIRCTVQPHSASPVDVFVSIGSSTFNRANGYTYTDALNLTGPTVMSGNQSGTYTVSLDYNYTGTVTLSDGGIGGTFSGANVSGGNRLIYSDQISRTFTYTPPPGYQGDITLAADSGVSYVDNDSLTLTVTIRATNFTLQCRSNGLTGAWTTNPFFAPGTPLACQIALNGIYDGAIDLQILVAGAPVSRGTFASSDPRLSGSIFTLTATNTASPSNQILDFTYTPPTWSWLLANDYDGTNGYWIFWPTMNAVSNPALTPAQRSVSMGLLAQAYEIISINNPPLDSPGATGCVGCSASFNISTFNAPYFGSITVDNSTTISGSSALGGEFFINNTWLDSITINFNGSGASELFRYRPNTTGDPISVTHPNAGVHTLAGSSSSPTITNDDITFNVINSHVSLVCTPTYLARGDSATCLLIYNNEGIDAGVDISLQDIYVSAYGVEPETDLGIFIDTSGIGSSSNPAGTWAGGKYSFCGGFGNDDCTGETWERTFIYTVPIDIDDDYAVFRIIARNEDATPVDSNWEVFDIIPDKILILCTDEYPDCDLTRVGKLQNYILRPNGVFLGQVQLSDGDPESIFSDEGIATWNFNGDDFISEYTPASPGIKTITATVIKSDDSNSGIKVGDKYYFTVIVMGDEIFITGPDFVARDEIPTMPRFSAIMEGPFVGTITGRMVRYSGTTEIPFTSSTLAGFNLVDTNDGTFTCTVTMSQFESGKLYPGGPPFYDSETNTTTACIADSGGPEGFILDYNWFEIIVSTDDVADAIHHVGLIADDYAVTEGGVDATTRTVIGAVGTPLDFMLTPNALFAGTYTFDDNEASGYFLPPGSITRTTDQWPVTNNQNLQSQVFTFIPLQTGYHTITIGASRSGPGIPPSTPNLPTKTVDVLIVANNITINGPSSVVRGATYEYSVVLNGPWQGRIYLSDSMEGYCDLTFSDYDSTTNTTSCDFHFTVDDVSPYANTVAILASDAGSTIITSKSVNIIADDFDLDTTVTLPTDKSVLPATPTENWRMVVDNRRLYTPIEFTLTPDAQFSGTFEIAMTTSFETTHAQPCPTASQFYADISPDQITYQYIEYAGINQNPLPKIFAVTPQTFGHVCILVTPIYTDPAYAEAGVTIEPKALEIRTYDGPHIGGPPRLVAESTDNLYRLIMEGEPKVVADFWAVDPTTCNAVDPYDCDSPISDIILAGDQITQDSSGAAQCIFDESNWGSDTTLIPATCSFTLSLPNRFVGNYIRIISMDDEGGKDYYDIPILANAFSLTPTEVIGTALDQSVTFTVTPLNGLYTGTFSLTDDGDGLFHPTSVTFLSSEWPTDNTLMAGQTFTYAPHHYGWNTITITDTNINNNLGYKTARLLVFADTMDLTGPDAIQISGAMTGNYTLNIHGPYIGTFNFTVTDVATSSAVGGINLSNSGSCTVTVDDYDELTNSTLCEFTLTLPANYSGSHYIRITATDASASIAAASTITTITANDYALSPSTEQTVAIGTPVTFTLTPNAVYNGQFGVVNNRTSTISPLEVQFSRIIDYPITNKVNVGKTFTVTPTQPGRHTIMIVSPLGTKTVTLLVLADDIVITGPNRIQKGTTSDEFTLTINGPYEGTVAVSTYIPDGATGLPATGVILSEDTFTFTLNDYDEVTNTTTATFTIDIPATHDTNYIGIRATNDDLSADLIVAITANEFTLTPGITTGTVGTPITFTITPNGLFAGTITLSDNGAGGAFSPTSVVFSSSTWPANTNQDLPAGRTFTYTPTIAGEITITASDANVTSSGLGNQEALITVAAKKDPPTNPTKPPEHPNTGAMAQAQNDFARTTSIIGALATIIILTRLLTRKCRR